MDLDKKKKPVKKIVVEKDTIENTTEDTLNSSAENVTEEDLKEAFSKEPVKKESGKKEKVKLDKKSKIFLIVGIFGIIGGLTCILLSLFCFGGVKLEMIFPKDDAKNVEDSVYSSLTGEILTDKSLVDAPAFCVQTPNGTDGARPQVGLAEAGVVFEAIAESGITRFAAIYQNPGSAIIGPIRSLRIYYLEWDTPFDCTIVHAGGSGDALAAISSGGYRDLSEDYEYMYRVYSGNRLWNNLFTTSAYLKKFNSDRGYDSSKISGFSRMTPKESNKELVEHGASEILDILKATETNTSEITPEISGINIDFGGWPNFNVHYDFNMETNTYNRSYASGEPHQVYKCEALDLGEKNPEDVCSLAQISPSVVVVMMVKESKASDNYHEDITTIGTGDAYIFQNGIVIKGTWSKASKNDQIKFFDEGGEEFDLAPGQTFVSAVPSYGSVEY